MKRILPLALTFLLASIALYVTAGIPQRNNTVVLKYIDATAAYQSVKALYPEISQVVTGIQVTKNTITLDINDPRADVVRKRLADLDQRPKGVVLHAIVSVTDKAHADMPDTSADRVLSRPTFYFMEGKPTVIVSEALDNGKYMKITITGTSEVPIEEK